MFFEGTQHTAAAAIERNKKEKEQAPPLNEWMNEWERNCVWKNTKSI